MTPDGVPVATSASILPPPPTSMRVPVTPPIPGTPAYYQSSIASTGAAIRQGQLQQSMADTLGPTGLGSAVTPPSNPFQQIFHSLTSSPLLSKFNALVEPTVRRQA